MRISRTVFFIPVLTGVLACSGQFGSNVDPQNFELDPARGIRIAVTRSAPFATCSFTASGGSRRVVFYRMQAPDALWRVFAQPRWIEVAHCDARAANRAELPISDGAESARPLVGRDWLITAWDSTTRGRWSQMERYQADSRGGMHFLWFGHPAVPGGPASFAFVMIPPATD